MVGSTDPQVVCVGGRLHVSSLDGLMHAAAAAWWRVEEDNLRRVKERFLSAGKTGVFAVQCLNRPKVSWQACERFFFSSCAVPAQNTNFDTIDITSKSSDDNEGQADEGSLADAAVNGSLVAGVCTGHDAMRWQAP